MAKSEQEATISVAIATFNEEKNITKCLDAVSSWVNEIIIVDGNSTDNTVKLAGKYPNTKIINTDNKPIFHINKQMAIDACKSDWILQLDADEIVSDKLKNEIVALLKKPAHKIEENGFWIKRKNYFLGTFLKKGGQYPDPTIRFYKKGKGYLPCESVHEQAHIDGKIGWLTQDLEHYADTSFSHYFLRNNRYTTLIAQDLIKEGQNIGFFPFISFYFIKPIFWFLLTFFRHKGFVDGFPGFVFSFYSALRFPIAYTKLWELKKTNRDVNLSQDWDK